MLHTANWKARHSQRVHVLNVDLEGLAVLADRCSAVAGELEATAAPACGPSSHAAATAIQALQNAVDIAGCAMAARLRGTSDMLFEAGAAFAGNEAESARRVNALTPAHCA